MFRIKLQKMFGLPVPSALPLRSITGTLVTEFSWEDWHDEMKKEYPIRYFLLNRIPHYLTVHIKMPIDDFIYYIKCHSLKEYKFHLLDLRNNEYKFGYQDQDTKLLYASFAILNEYAKAQDLDNYIKMLENESVNIDRLNACKEIKKLQNWFLYDRPLKEEEINKALYIAVENGKKARINETYDFFEIYKEYEKLKEELRADENNAMRKIIDLRDFLWT